MDVCRDEHRVTSIIRDSTNASHKVTDRPSVITIARSASSSIIGLAAKPGIISLLFDVLFEGERALSGVRLLLLLLAVVRIVVIVLRLLSRWAQWWRAIFCKENVQ